MSIGICFNDDVPWGDSTEDKRNGMSVKEIYEALDRLERLEKAYNEKRIECEKLTKVIQKSIDYNVRTSTQYHRVASSTENLSDKLEFLSKASALLEATTIMRQYIKDAAKGEFIND